MIDQSGFPSLEELSLIDAYNAIYNFFNFWTFKPPKDNPDFEESIYLIQYLPHPRSISSLEIRAVFHEIINGRFRWAYNYSYGPHQLNEYIDAALVHSGLNPELSAKEKEELANKPLGGIF